MGRMIGHQLIYSDEYGSLIGEVIAFVSEDEDTSWWKVHWTGQASEVEVTEGYDKLTRQWHDAEYTSVFLMFSL